MDRSSALMILTFFTLLAGMAIAAYQLWHAEHTKKTSHTAKPIATDENRRGSA